jgi:hypothetical protein
MCHVHNSGMNQHNFICTEGFFADLTSSPFLSCTCGQMLNKTWTNLDFLPASEALRVYFYFVVLLLLVVLVVLVVRIDVSQIKAF